MSECGAAALGVERGRPHETRSFAWRTVGRNLAKALSTDVLMGVALAVLWTLGHGFVGIEGDARIYMGRALADVDPAGVGRDIMFTLDGQSSFTIFRLLAKTLVASVGFNAAVAILTTVNLVTWLVAMVTLVRTIVPGRAGALVLATVIVLPRVYAAWNLLTAGESIPVPRPLAEAGVLLAFAALCRGRALVSLACLLLAALLHPIMAAPGFGVLLVTVGLRDRRWLVAAALLGIAVLAAAAMGLPLVSRLMTTMDPTWRAVLTDRNPYLFMRLWPHEETIAALTVRGVTIALACLWLPGRARVIFIASLAIGCAGVVVSFVFGDELSNLLILQAQPWRALWLSAVLAPVAAGLCLLHMPKQGAPGRIALAFLALAWIAIDSFPLGPLAAILAFASYVGGRRVSLAQRRASVVTVWITCVVAAALSRWPSIMALDVIIQKMPPGVALPWTIVWSLGILTMPIMLLVVAWWRWPGSRATRAGGVLMVALGFTVVVTRWNCRQPARAEAYVATHDPELATMIASRGGDVLWVGADDVWYRLGRPNWNSSTQGSSIAFSRALAIKWHDRVSRSIRFGLATPNLLKPRDEPVPLGPPKLDHEKLVGFCAFPDAPAWIMAPLDEDASPPSGLGIRIWTPTAAPWTLLVGSDDVRWSRSRRYAVIPCA